jgi:hypothetical protein
MDVESKIVIRSSTIDHPSGTRCRWGGEFLYYGAPKDEATPP